MNKSIKDAIDARFSSVNAPDDLAAKIKLRAHSRAKRIVFPVKRLIAAAATFCLVTVLSVGVMAASFPQLNSLFSIIGDRLASLVQPIVKTSESNGIKMEVLAALNDNDSVIIYLTLQDLTQNRINSTLSLYNFDIPGVMFPHAEVINFDEASRIATVKITGMNGNKLDGSKITVSLNTILSNNTVSEYEDTGLTVSDIARLNPTPQIYYPESMNESVSNFDTSDTSIAGHEKLDPTKMPYLKPEAFTLNISGCDWAYLSGAGIIDNTLHLQLNPDDKAGRYNEICYALADENGKLNTNLYSVTAGFGTRKSDSIHYYSDYYENVILLPNDSNINSHKIYAAKNTFENRIDGNWSTTFELQSNNEIKKASCIINMNPWEITEVSVSAIGVTLKGHGKMYEYSSPAEVTVKRVDGSIVDCNASSSKFEELPDGTESIVIQNMFNLPMDVKEIASVNINGVDIALK